MRKTTFLVFLSIALLTASIVYGEEKMEQNIETNKTNYKKAAFAGGCFWCMQGPFDRLGGVIDTDVGYTGGEIENPKYEEVASGRTKHAEAIIVTYDPDKIGYEQLLDVFWMNIDPTDDGGQFADRGYQYRTAIFYHNEEQKALAEASKGRLEKSGKFKKPIVTNIEPANEFYRGEEYHQEYYKKNPIKYKLYKYGSGRGPYLEQKWGKETED